MHVDRSTLDERVAQSLLHDPDWRRQRAASSRSTSNITQGPQHIGEELPSREDSPSRGFLAYLALMVDDSDMLFTTARLYLHLLSQIDKKRQDREREWDDLRRRHEEELSAFLACADVSGTSHSLNSSNVLIDYHLTESTFERHSREVTALAARHRSLQEADITEARRNFFSFVKTAGPEVLQHQIHLNQTGAPSQRPDGQRVAKVRQRNIHRSVSHFSRGVPPVRVVKIVNPLRGKVIGARPRDPSLAAIVLEVSPLDTLLDCSRLSQSTGRSSSGDDEDVQEQMALKICDHFTRLAQGKHSLLVWIGDTHKCTTCLGLTGTSGGVRNADELPDSSGPCELILPAGTALPFQWYKYEQHPINTLDIRIGFSTSSYVGNIVLAISGPALSETASFANARTRDELTKLPWYCSLEAEMVNVLHFAFSRGVSRLSVAVPQAADCCAPAVLHSLHQSIATVQLEGTCFKPPMPWGLTAEGLLNGLGEFHSGLPTFTTNSATDEKANAPSTFNLPLCVRVFLGESMEKEGLERLLQQCFEGDAGI